MRIIKQSIVAAALVCAAATAASAQQVGGLNISFDLSRTMVGGKVEVTEDQVGRHHGTYNLTGPMIGTTMSYLFQNGQLVVGAWGRVSGGFVEAMPYVEPYRTVTIRRNLTGLAGLEGGWVFGRWYPHLRIGGGGAWASAASPLLGETTAAISALYAGVGVNYYINPGLFVAVEGGVTRFGDFPAVPLYLTPRDEYSGMLRLGVRF